MQVTLTYELSGLTYSRAFNVLKAKGLDDPDKLFKVGIVHDILDGSLKEQVRGFRKLITLSFKPNLLPIETRFLANWFDTEIKRVVYLPYVSLAITDKDLVSNWLYEMEYGRAFDVQVEDPYVYHKWDDGISTDDDMIYFLNNVEISQDATAESPEVLTTNANKLQYMQNGAPWPAFDSTLYDHLIWVLASGPASDICTAEYGHSAIVTGGNMVISVAVGSGYQPSPSGKLYADIAIYPRLKTL